MSGLSEAERLAEALHVEHMQEFGKWIDDEFPAAQCGNCQRWARYVIAAGCAAQDARLRERIEALADTLEQWCQARCRACYDAEFAKRHSHDCGITRLDVVSLLRAALDPEATS